jgi:hypothetical protein
VYFAFLNMIQNKTVYNQCKEFQHTHIQIQ